MISFDNVGFRYGVGPEILRDVSITFEAGSFHYLAGVSGAGKSTLLNLMHLSLRPTRGFLSVLGQDVRTLRRRKLPAMRRRIGMVFQDFRLLEHISVFDNVALPLRLAGGREREIRRDVTEILEWVGLGDAFQASPRALSGGEQQRVAIARAVVSRPSLLLADEPTGSVDDVIGHRIMRLFEELHRLGTAVVIATHNWALIERFPHAQLQLVDGALIRLPGEQVADGMIRIPLQPETRAARALSLVVIALMVTLGIVVLGAALSIRHVDLEWRQALAGKWTVELDATAVTAPITAADIENAVARLKTIPGFADARVVAPAEIRRLLQPWLRDPALAAELPLPVLIDVTIDPTARPSPSGAAQRVAAALPGAKLDDHSTTTRDLLRLAQTGEALGLVMFAAITLTTILTVAATARARLAINRPEIELLHHLGASDGYIARQFQTVAFRSAVFGAALGTMLAASIGAALFETADVVAPLIPQLKLAQPDWALLATVPVGAVVLTTVVARWTAQTLTRRLP